MIIGPSEINTTGNKITNSTSKITKSTPNKKNRREKAVRAARQEENPHSNEDFLS